MLDCISVANMRESDRKTIENITPSLTLMYRAALGVFRSTEWKGKISIVCGGGNNGGDGFALAAILKKNGIESTVYMLSEKQTPDARHYFEEAVSLGVECRPFEGGKNVLENSDIIVDCLLGTGFAGEVREPIKTAIEEINNCPAFVISVDINSGMNGDTGEGKLIVRSDLTVTIGFVKHGLIAEASAEYIGKLVVTDIGIKLDREEKFIIFPSDNKETDGEKNIAAPGFLSPEVIVCDKETN